MSYKQALLLLLILSLMLPASGFGAQYRGKKAAPNNQQEYSPEQRYEGIFDNDRLYVLPFPNRNWVGSKAPANLRQLLCGQARAALSLRGHWNGFLDYDGRCQKGDSFDWMMGNYLNFRGQKNPAE